MAEVATTMLLAKEWSETVDADDSQGSSLGCVVLS